jgi:hypothetical protein
MENQIYLGHTEENYSRIETKERDQKPKEASTTPSTMQGLKLRWNRFVASLPEMPYALDRPGFYHNETMTPDQVRHKVSVPGRFAFTG